MRGALSDESTGLSFTIDAGPHQCSYSRVTSPVRLVNLIYCLKFETSPFVSSYDSQGYGGGIRPCLPLSLSLILRTTNLGLTTRFLLLTVAGLLMLGVLSDMRTGLPFKIAAWPRQSSHFLARVPWDSTTIFYSLRFETSFFMAFYVSQGYGGCIRPRLHTGVSNICVSPL
jgi:hypothetical protein